MLCFFFLLISFPLAIHSHGNMMMPTTWMDPGGRIGLRNQKNCVGTFSSCLWFTNYTFISGKPTLDHSLWTYPKMFLHNEPVFSPHDLDYTGSTKQQLTKTEEDSLLKTKTNEIPPLKDYFYNHPWRSPGSAKVHSPCGVLGGNPAGCPATAPYGEGNICPGGGFGYGPRAEEFPFRDVVTTKWRAGAVVEVGWGINANHGGGYSYRLCKLPKGGKKFLTEECFQETPLRFVGDLQWVQYGDNRSTRIGFKANRTREGTFPSGSEWTKNPIPACAGGWGGFLDKDPDCREGTQFDPPAPGLKGFGAHIYSPGQYDFNYTIIDQVEVPAGIKQGQYVLSFRWDCEQTPQVWTACADIKIKKK